MSTKILGKTFFLQKMELTVSIFMNLYWIAQTLYKMDKIFVTKKARSLKDKYYFRKI